MADHPLKDLEENSLILLVNEKEKKQGTLKSTLLSVFDSIPKSDHPSLHPIIQVAPQNNSLPPFYFASRESKYVCGWAYEKPEELRVANVLLYDADRIITNRKVITRFLIDEIKAGREEVKQLYNAMRRRSLQKV